ncbi:MAG: hypothetical protein IPK64_20515 [bacterium]|jgi:hypothetical protein|nr:hypothetical protein [bacterium]
MITRCALDTCAHITDMPNDSWLVIRPLVWNATAVDITCCSPRCAVLWLEATYAPPKGLLP